MTTTAAPITAQMRAVIDAPEFATLATLAPGGRPRLSVVWLKTDGNDVLVSTTAEKLKYHDVVRDPRVSLLVYPKEQPYVYVAIDGTATTTTDGGPELIQELSRRYSGAPYTFDGPDAVRVVIRITPTRAVFSDPQSRRVKSASRSAVSHSDGH
jgi:PPOX class probable F420-dependent enzyme